MVATALAALTRFGTLSELDLSRDLISPGARTLQVRQSLLWHSEVVGWFD